MNAMSRAIAVGLAAAVLQAVMLIAFAWPAANLKPRDLPLVVTGPQAASVADKLTQHDPAAFAITTVPDEPAARSALEHRDAYGAIVTGGGQPRLLVASAASPVVAQLLTQMGQQLVSAPGGPGAPAGSSAPVASGAPGAPADPGAPGASAGPGAPAGPSAPAGPGVPVAPAASGAPSALIEDIVPADSHDPRGAAFGAMVLPLVMAGIAAGALLSLLIPILAARVAGLFTFAVAAGLLSMSVVQGWLDILPGSYLTLAAVAALVSFAVAGSVVGLAAVVGRPGIGIAALLLLLIGNPFSAATSAPELLPTFWGSLGQYLPPGAAATLLRSVAFFDSHALTTPLTVLLTWSAAALILITLAALRPQPAPTPA